MRKLIILLPFLLFACHPSPKKEADMVKDSVKKDSSVILQAIDSSNYTGPDDTIPKILIPNGAIQVDNSYNVVDTLNRTYMLYPNCTYYAEDIDPLEINLKWKGLFITENTCYIQDTKVKFSKAESEADHDGKKTGWKPKSNDKNLKCLFSGVTYFTDGNVKNIALHKNILYPGEKEEFVYNGIKYTFYATGHKKDGDIFNYKLFLTATIKGNNFNQQLASFTHFGEKSNYEDWAKITINFAGDIDGDKIPDFIFEKTSMYADDATLYLSKPADNKAILKAIAINSFYD